MADTAVFCVANRAALKSVSSSAEPVVTLANEGGRNGTFIWTAGNFLSQIATDTGEGIYIKANAVAATSGAWVRNHSGVLNLKWFGIIGDGVADDTAAVQAAVETAQNTGQVLLFNAVANSVRTTAPINITKSIRIYGEGVDPGGKYGPNEGTNSAGIANRGPGSWLFADHPGRAIVVTSSSSAITGVEIRDIGTIRPQPTPAAGFVPANNDYDIYIAGADVTLNNIMLWNSTYGIYQTVGAYTYGRLNAKNIRGQPLLRGIVVENSYDVCRLENIHFWPFWSHNLGVWTYTLANGIALSSGRNDNPFLSNIFCIFYNIGLRVYGNANGTTYKLKMVNCDIDRGRHGIFVDSTADQFTAHFENVSAQGETGATNGAGVIVNGTNAQIAFGKLDLREFAQNAILVQGSGNNVSVVDPLILNWDKLAAGTIGIQVNAGSTIDIYGRIRRGTTTGTGPLMSGGGTLRYPGLVTRGAASITSGNTLVVVNHGLPMTPTNSQIVLSKLSGLASAVDYWLTGITATQFTIQVSQNPGTTITFAWRASLE